MKEGVDISDKEDLLLEKYFKDIRKYPLLTPDDEYELALKIKNNDDERAKEKLIQSNLRFVVLIAKQHVLPSIKLMDLINEGNIGLIIAVNKFDPDRGIKFISYAVWWIKQRILNFLRNNKNMVLEPRDYSKYRKMINKFENHFINQNDRVPHEDEIWYGLQGQIPRKALKEIKQNKFQLISLEEGIENNFRVIDILGGDDENFLENGVNYSEVIKSLFKRCFLTLREQEIISLHLGLFNNEPMTFREIADVYYKGDVSYQRMQQIYTRGLQKLKGRGKRYKNKILYQIED